MIVEERVDLEEEVRTLRSFVMLGRLEVKKAN